MDIMINAIFYLQLRRFVGITRSFNDFTYKCSMITKLYLL